ncbi:hypothetical protein B0H15DRAFT_549610 [Mycena belliarum]|uniref:Uncharacterized protein n=1 Tax=Mycena belliarum TaxID=1033014 RepID=A0AAD6UE70_9AGAR|nr:hypothetical protein B0H15DRAFT_549610 [Mycena belliae]
MPASRGSPVAPTRATSLRKLANILRTSRRVHSQPSLTIPQPATNGPSPPSSPSLYTLSSDGDSQPLVSPTLSTFSSSASEGHGDYLARREFGGTSKYPLEYATPDSDDDRETDLIFSCPGISHGRYQRSSPSDEYTTLIGESREGSRTQPPDQCICADEDGRLISDTSSLRAAGKRGERTKLQLLTPSEWIGSNVQPKTTFLRAAPLFQVEYEDRSPTSDLPSPITPRPRPTSEIHRSYTKPGDLDTPLPHSRSRPITELPELELLTDSRRRPRSASEPRSFPGTPFNVSRHARSVSSTPTEYILPVPCADAAPMSSFPQPTSSSPGSSQPSSIAPSNWNTSPLSPEPEDVYFTAAGRRESRIYINPGAAPYRVPMSSMRGHAHSNSEPILFSDDSSTSLRCGTRSKWQSGQPFEDSVMQGAAFFSGDNTPVARKEDLWSGEWNRDDIQDVIKQLRSLK